MKHRSQSSWQNYLLHSASVVGCAFGNITQVKYRFDMRSFDSLQVIGVSVGIAGLPLHSVLRYAAPIQKKREKPIFVLTTLRLQNIILKPSLRHCLFSFEA